MRNLLSNHPVTRRNFLQGTSLTALGALLAACGQGGTAAKATELPATKAAKGEISELSILWENWGENYNKLMLNIGTAFETDNPDIKLKWDFPPEQATKFLTMVAAGTPPEVAFLRPQSMAQLAKKGTLIPMDSYMATGGYKRDDFVSPIYNASFYDGKLWAVPGGADYYALFWSKDVYKEAGLDPEKPPKSLDELIEHSKTILKKDENGEISRIGYTPSAWEITWWVFFFGGRFYDEATKKITFNEDPVVEVFQKVYDYIKFLDINKLAAFQKRPGMWEAGNPFSAKQATYTFDGFWAYDTMDKYSPDIDYGITTWPTKNGTEDELKNYFMQGWMVGIPKGTKHPDEAWRFLKYGFIDKSDVMGYSTLNGPCYKNVLPGFEAGVIKALGEKNRMTPYMNVFTKIATYASKAFPVIPVNQFYYDEITRIFDLIMRDQVSIKDGLNEVTKNVQTELDKAMQA